MEITRIFDLLDWHNKHWPEKTNALGGKDEGKWIEYSVDEYTERSCAVSYGLMALGIQKGDKIATITFNRPEWNFLDMGIQMTGAVHVPIYPTISDKDYEYILSHAEVKIIFVAGEEMYRRIKHIIPNVPSLKAIYTFKNLHGFEHLGELMDLGRKNAQPEKLKEIKASITTNDIASIIYTSGTVGNPKGVMLLHRNIISNFIAAAEIPPYGPEHSALSFLPLCHIYERMLNYMYQYRGISVYYAENIATVADNLKEINPEILCTVPRLLEKIYDKIDANGRKLKGVKRLLFRWAVSNAFRYELSGKSWYYYLKLNIARKLVFSKIRPSLGTNLDIIVSGGAALQPRLARFFWAMGYRVLEGYGLTETSPVLAVNLIEKPGVRFGTVGPILKGVTVKIAADGEILAQGPGIMAGYYHEPELTREAIDEEGWFHTGDIGNIDKDGFLKITGRKKEIFKTSFGKYIAPAPIENKFKESPFIDQIFVTGENQKFAGALIVPDFQHLKQWCERKEIPYTTNEEIVQLPRIRKRYLKEVNNYNHFFGDTEQIKRFELMPSEWTIESGELTATLKLRRTYITNKYAALIDKLFNN